MIGYTPGAVIKVYHVPDKRRRAEAICKHGIAAVAANPPVAYLPCPVCYGRTK